MDTTHDSDTGDAAGASRLGRLSEMDDFQVADGYPDIRGWEVKTADGRTIGKVDDLIADTGAMRVRYVDVELDRTVGEMTRDAATPGDQGRHTLLPIGAVRLDDAHDDVLVDGYTVEQVAGMPRYSGQSITPDYERSLHTRIRGDQATGALGAAAVGTGLGAAARAVDYEHDHFDDQRLFASRRDRARDRTAADESERLTLSEERALGRHARRGVGRGLGAQDGRDGARAPGGPAHARRGRRRAPPAERRRERRRAHRRGRGARPRDARGARRREDGRAARGDRRAQAGRDGDPHRGGRPAPRAARHVRRRCARARPASTRRAARPAA